MDTLFSYIGYPLRSRDVNMLGWRTRHPIPNGVDYPRTLTEFGRVDSCRRRRVRSFLGVFVGRKVFDARLAAEPTPGRRRGVSCDATASASNIGDGGDDLRGHSKAIAPLVPGDVVRDQPEARGCARPATPWPGQLSDRLGLAAQVAARHGEAGALIFWAARSRWTKPMWAAGKPARGATDEDQVDRRDCGGSPRAGHWPDPNEPRRGCGCEEPDPVCPNNRGAWRDRLGLASRAAFSRRWLVSLQWSGEPRL